MEDNNFKNVQAIQFNGWNFGHIYDWVNGKRGLYAATYYDEMELHGKIVHRNDWVVKNDDGLFSVMTNSEFEEINDK